MQEILMDILLIPKKDDLTKCDRANFSWIVEDWWKINSILINLWWRESNGIIFNETRENLLIMNINNVKETSNGSYEIFINICIRYIFIADIVSVSESIYIYYGQYERKPYSKYSIHFFIYIFMKNVLLFLKK